MKINFHPDDRMLRQFGLLCVLFFGGLCAARMSGGIDNVCVLTGVIAAVAGALAFTRPRLLKPVFVGWTIAVFPIGFLVSYIILLCLYFLVFAPVGLVLRLTGYDSLRLRDPGTATCWMNRSSTADLKRYFRQF